ncbi:MAG TPA: methylmalonyl-CoA mutase [Candidatus Syntrophoarchaeum butanivorans]|uniref:Methylmalonyl-CoA mutase n=1 Tax=Candidatus Syntropharchaeum butanivorans TaxID=1839936 RepID=A0A1F2P4U4_9EURY|nr:MAG: methylmalonyl-CoA mutase subunit beta [Candidatus Syntrophoarchaeum butanivorans]RJS71210.1 MAG: methylmalonyl-CoA mutase [Candidatus Syntrophoarchaeum sp. WYZ-LMO15]HDM36044.1 methylmalonyl-CoA mutase [Candidatus Syntrophoarchaeum butanivorans]HEC56402.1 methylmalonyl-CoA mutase [Candidatus Syntrophoarchaeum butanivorans]
MAEERKIRVLMSKPGVDGHWRGIVTVSRGLRDAGMEVIFGGFQSIEQIVETAIEEDVDVIGLSIHSQAHIPWTKRIVSLMEEKGIKDSVLLIIGGVIPTLDHERLKELGAAEVFGPGTPIKKIADFIRENVKRKQKVSAS